MFHKTIHKAWNFFSPSEQSSENSTKNPDSRFLIGRKLLSIDQMLFSIGRIGIEQRSRHPETLGFFLYHFKASTDRAKVLTNQKCLTLNFHLENSRPWIFTLTTLWNNILQTQTLLLLQHIHVYTYIYICASHR